MSEIKLLSKLYSNKAIKPRYVGNNNRSIKNRILALDRGKEFFDGKRSNGYGGYKYDGRWSVVAEALIKRYNLNDKSSILHINSEKGFLLYELKKIIPTLKIKGYETSSYAIKKTPIEIRKSIAKINNYLEINTSKKFDLTIAMGVVYSYSLKDAAKVLKILNKISNKSFITLASYKDLNDYSLFKNWTLLGTTILKKNEWKIFLKYFNYKGDYEFTNSVSLNLKKL